jgi:hypothetical protein
MTSFFKIIHTETLQDGTVLSTAPGCFGPGRDIDPRSGWCAISIDGECLYDRFGNLRTFKTFAAAKKAAIKWKNEQK